MLLWLLVVANVRLRGRRVHISRRHLFMSSLLISFGVPLSPILTTVPPVLDCIVTASFQSSCYFSPPLSHLLHHTLDLLPLFRSDWIVIE